MTAPRLLVVIPCLNEEAHLPALLDWLAADETAARIVVADGGSTDATRAIARSAAERDPRVIFLDNPRRVQSAAVNLAVSAFGDEFDMLARIDAHASYPADYLSRLVTAQRESGADAVAVSMRAAANTGRCFQRAVACAQNSALGTGGSPHRKGGARRFVDHGHHALFTIASFKRVGGYDESFTHNEDAELDARLIEAGGRILLAADIVIDYFPRATARKLARQYFAYGAGRARTALSRGQPLKLRQLAPALIAPLLVFGLAGAPLTPWAIAPASAWLSVCLLYGALLGLRERDLCACGAGVAAAIMHASWSAGFARQLIRQIGRTNPMTTSGEGAIVRGERKLDHAR